MAITIISIMILVLLSAFFSGSESALTGASEAYMTDQDKNENKHVVVRPFFDILEIF